MGTEHSQGRGGKKSSYSGKRRKKDSHLGKNAEKHLTLADKKQQASCTTEFGKWKNKTTFPFLRSG